MRYLIVILIIIGISSCGEAESRKPIKVKTGSIFKESIARNKKLLAEEEKLIQKIIAKDSVNNYLLSNTGSSYYYNSKNDTASYLPKTDDLVSFTYDIKSFTNDTIYSKSDIGVITYKVDKDKLFPGLRSSIKLLKEKEIATFLYPSSRAYGYHGDNNKIGPNTPIKATITILKINKTTDSIQN